MIFLLGQFFFLLGKRAEFGKNFLEDFLKIIISSNFELNVQIWTFILLKFIKTILCVEWNSLVCLRKNFFHLKKSKEKITKLFSRKIFRKKIQKIFLQRNFFFLTQKISKKRIVFLFSCKFCINILQSLLINFFGENSGIDSSNSIFVDF